MKLILINLILVTAALFGCKDTDDRIIQPSELPGAAQTFIETHFSGTQFVVVTVDKELTETTYDVILNNGVKLEFDSKGVWKEVETPGSQVPSGIVPEQILAYVAEKYPDVKIVKINRDRRDYEVDLSNGIELKFDRNTFDIIGVDLDSLSYVAEPAGKGHTLPAPAKAFIAEHFGGKTITGVKVDRDGRSVSYDVILSDGTKLEFDQAGEWEEVNTRTYAVPAAIIPVQIRNYVAPKYPGAYIVRIDRDSRDYEIDLSNGVEIKFDLYFNVIKVENDHNNGNNDNNQPGVAQLPAPAKAFIAQYFAGKSVVSVKVDRDDRRVSYDVILSDGTKLDFDYAGEWEEVNTYTYAVPAAIIPAPIRRQVVAVYPYEMIVKIDRDTRDYEVKLSNGIELKFDRNSYRLIGKDSDDHKDNDHVVGYDELPAPAKAFISQHFASLKVVKVERDRDDGKITYEVRLSDRTELEFRQNGEWKEVNTRTYPVPGTGCPC